MGELVSVNSANAALFTDLYELTMLQAYHAEAMRAPAAFELYYRELPGDRNFVMACGLEDVLDYLESFRFAGDDLDYLRRQGKFNDTFLEYLMELRFTGDVYAVREGTIVFPNEPVVQVVAPMPEAQVVETFILNQVHFQSVVATKAARVILAADGRQVVDFGSRRAHGTDAAMKVARTSYIAGAIGTSNVLAGKVYGIPIFGTMAHSYIQAHEDEGRAFEQFMKLHPGTTLLVDTYDTIEGVRRVIELARRSGERFNVAAVRLDSGDMAALAREARRLLDEAGLRQMRIFASSGLDEYRIARMVADGAPIDAFGVGTRMAVSRDAPDLDFSYKLVEYGGRGRMKLSRDKLSLPGRKQVFRRMEGGLMVEDVVGRHDEALEGEPLLVPVMRGGRRLDAGGPGAIERARARAKAQLDALSDVLRRPERADQPYPVRISERLQQDRDELRRSLVTGHSGQPHV